ncbi:MAG TPA: hypothetical protein VM846_09875 [Vicinamibacterales bacterium]|jgi:ribosomal protein S27AE|nr:hypothetical protein [Vicinamibacterales bacterium]
MSESKSQNPDSTITNDSQIANHQSDIDSEATTCPRCNESKDLAKVKGCIKCLKCGYKFDCNGW